MENNFQQQSYQPPVVKRNLPRDVFLHLFAMVTLYWSAITVIALLWQYVNYFFPDALNYGYNNFGTSIRFQVSSLIIVFPLFMLVSWLLNKIYKKEAQVRESKIRKWLIYLTLFFAALVIVGDLVVVINAFLSGEITVRFILKALSILVIAGVIFGYYLDDVRRAAPSALAKQFAWATSIIVAIAIVGAFFIVGSPMKARAQQFDQQRVNDLYNIQYQVVNFWQRKGQLPSSLTVLKDSISGYVVPVDPETHEPYQYNIKNAANLNFELCADFKTSYAANNPKMSAPVPVGYDMYSQNFDHETGHVCFDRTIDKELYPPLTKGR